MSHSQFHPLNSPTSSLSVSMLAILVLVLSALSLGCDGNAIPEKIAFPTEESGIAGSICSGEPDGECEPIEIGMCGFTYRRPSMKLGKLVDYDYIDDGVPCEELEYRRPHAIATFQVLDPIAGEDMGTTLELINFGTDDGHRQWEPGSYYIFYPWQRAGMDFLGYTREVLVDDDAAAFEDSSSDIAGGDIVYDVPTNYAAFAAEAEEYWYNFDEKCPDHDLHVYGEVMSDEMFEEHIYEKECPGDDVGVNQNAGEDPWSESEDDDF